MAPFLGRKQSECVLVLDIGSGSVGAALALTSNTSIPTILYSVRSEIPFQEAANAHRLLALMQRALLQVLALLESEGFTAAGFGAKRPRIRKCAVSLSAPWVVSQTSILKLQNEKPVKITKEIFEVLKEESRRETRSKEESPPTGSVEIDARLMRSTLNGYTVASPFGKEASTAEFAMLRSFSLPKVTATIADPIRDTLNVDRLHFLAFSFLEFLSVERLFPREKDFITVDVSGEQTELAIVKKGMIAHTATFPTGRKHFLRRFKRNAGIPAVEAGVFLRLHNERGGAGAVAEQVKEIIGLEKENWRNRFAKTLGTFSEEIVFPKSVYVAADEDTLPLIADALQTGDFEKFTFAPKAFHVTLLQSPLLNQLVQWSNPRFFDPFLCMVSAFAGELSE